MKRTSYLGFHVHLLILLGSHTVPDPAQRLSYMNLLRYTFPVLNMIPKTTAVAKKMKEDNLMMRRIGLELVQRKKDAIIAEAGNGSAVEKSSVKTRDLLSLLIKANMASGIPELQKMSDEEVLAQISTFLVAGHETTNSSAAWALFELARHPEVQTRLRAELTFVSTENLTMDELLALPYLDVVVREAPRVRAVVNGTGRISAKDAVIPLSKFYVDTKGVVRHEIRLKKGERVDIPITLLKKSSEIWGKDAEQFNPDR